MSKAKTAVNYGIDAPMVIRNLLLIGCGGLLLVFLSRFVPAPLWLNTALAAIGWTVAGLFFLQAIYCVWSSKVGKLKQRDLLLDELALRGDERVLDVGCGRGLLLIGAARRLPRGTAVGIDLWQAEDLTDNSAAATRNNLVAAGVTARTEVVTGDMRQMPFATDSFDAIVSSLVVHNVYTSEERRAAISEIYRVLKPGGRLRIQDIRHTADYVEILRSLGAKDVTRSKPVFNVYGAQTVAATKG